MILEVDAVDGVVLVNEYRLVDPLEEVRDGANDFRADTSLRLDLPLRRIDDGAVAAARGHVLQPAHPSDVLAGDTLLSGHWDEWNVGVVLAD